MMLNSCVAIERCHNKRSKSIRLGNENDDPFSELPNDILLSIISYLTMKDAARLSLVSHRWEFMWRCAPLLIFENPRAMRKIRKSFKAIPKERVRFVRWVNRVLERHSGEVIDELRITFDLDQIWHAFVDNWVAIALAKHVKRLELDFSSKWERVINNASKPVAGERLDLPPKFGSINSSIVRLCLKYVNATDEFIDSLPRSCPLLENLCIVGSKCLTKVSAPFKRVKHLELSLCDNLKTIDISAPKLCSFVHYNRSVELLHIADASSLVDLTVGRRGSMDNIAYLFDPLSEYLSQLVYLRLRICLSDAMLEPTQEIFGSKNPYPLPNVRHLELRVFGGVKDTLQELTFLIAASPNLHKLVLKLDAYPIKTGMPEREWVGFPIKCLKTLEVVGYVGTRIDLELVVFVFENACMLEEVILSFMPPGEPFYDKEARERVGLLQEKLPQGVKLNIQT